MKKGFKIILIIICILLVLFTAGGVLAGNYSYNLALNPHSDKSDVLNADHNQFDLESTSIPEIDEAYTSAGAAAWLKTVNRKDAIIVSHDDLQLHAFSVTNEQPTTQWAILCHGYTGNSSQMSVAARIFYEFGYNVLAPDARGHGDSNGDYIGMGWHDRLDIVGWVSYIIEQDPNAQIVLYGVSMGGATVMMVSGEQLPENVKAIVEDCGYTSVYDEFAYQLKSIFGLPAFPVMNFASLVTSIRAGYTLKEASATKQVEKSQTPILFIHGDSDTFVPSEMVYEVYDAACCEKDIFIVEGAGHGMASYVASEQYWMKVEQFLNQYVK